LFKFVTILIGVPFELANQAGQTPLLCASFKGHYDVVKLFIEFGADPNRRCSNLSAFLHSSACCMLEWKLQIVFLLVDCRYYSILNIDCVFILDYSYVLIVFRRGSSTA
jgi:ankyrin repeat protein